jgi:hypothetical protein
MSDLQLPTALASRRRRSVMEAAVQGLGSSRGAHISIRGGRFRLIDAKGIEKLVDTHYLDMVVIDANDKPARVYFEGAYDPSSDTPPACFSDNGTGPSTQAMTPQAPSCMECPRNVRGTKQTFTGKPTTACENRKKVAVIIPDDPAVNVYEFQIPPGSLSNFKSYCQWLGSQASGVEGRAMDIADVVTRVAFDPDKQFVMTFVASAYADDERTMQLIEYIDANQLSDAAVGRNDVAFDPDRVRAMLAGAPTQAALPPAQTAPAPQAQQFTLPPRTAPAQVAAPVQEAAPPPASKPRGRPKAAQETQTPGPQGNGAAPDIDTSIPAFLRRTPDAPASANVTAPPRFGVGQAPPPPAEIADALSKAMALPTRRP